MRRRPHPEASLFTVHELDGGGDRARSNAIAEIHRGDYEGIVLSGALSPERCQGMLSGLEDSGLDRVPFPKRAGATQAPWTLGLPLMLSPEPGPYHEAAGRSRLALDALWGGDFEADLAELLGRFAGGRTVRLAHAEGRPCAPATIRVLPPGNAIGAHVGNDFVLLPQARRLAATLDIGCQLSWFIPLQTAEEGGELELYGLEFEDTRPLREQRPEGSDGMDELAGLTFLVELSDAMRLSPAQGELVLFDGGRWYHRVRPVHGQRPRITLGGFLAFSLDGRAIYFWS